MKGKLEIITLNIEEEEKKKNIQLEGRGSETKVIQNKVMGVLVIENPTKRKNSENIQTCKPTCGRVPHK